MALGGGTFTSMNKVLPGSYINVISKLTANATLSDRGVVALPIGLNYAPDNVFTVTSAELETNCRAVFGCEYASDELRPIREVFKNAHTVHLYNVRDNGSRASNTYASAKYRGSNGNNLKIRIDAVVDDANKFDVVTLFGNNVVDSQRITKTESTTADNGLKDNDYVTFNKTKPITAAVAATSLTGGSAGTGGASSHETALNKLEAYAFNVLVCTAGDGTLKGLYANYTKRNREEVGKKFQTVMYNYDSADYEGVINVKNSADAIYWTAGALAGCQINRSLTNAKYDGEYEISTDYTQDELVEAINDGFFVFHNVNDEVRVLLDRNSLVTYTEDKSELFNDNQVIRVADQIANDIAVIFNTKYIGAVQNNATGRALFKADIIQHHNQLQDMNAIEDFTADSVTIEAGTEKGAVVVTDAITVVGTMTKLYMTVYVS